MYWRLYSKVQRLISAKAWVSSHQTKYTSSSSLLPRGIRNPGVRQCLGFCSADSKANEYQKSAVQKPKHCLTPGFLIPLVIYPIGKWGQKISCTKPKHCLTPGFLIHLLLPNRLRGFRCRTRSRAWSRSSCRALSSSWPRTAPSSPYRSRRRSSAPWWAVGRIYSVLEVLWLRLLFQFQFR